MHIYAYKNEDVEVLNNSTSGGFFFKDYKREKTRMDMWMYSKFKFKSRAFVDKQYFECKKNVWFEICSE